MYEYLTNTYFTPDQPFLFYPFHAEHQIGKQQGVNFLSFEWNIVNQQNTCK